MTMQPGSDEFEQVSRPVVREISILEIEGACFMNEKKISVQDLKIPIPAASKWGITEFCPFARVSLKRRTQVARLRGIHGELKRRKRCLSAQF
jgi:hypothetical protein